MNRFKMSEDAKETLVFLVKLTTLTIVALIAAKFLGM